MLDLDSGREASAPRPAATLVLLRDATPTGAVEVFCVERNKTSRFLGGAIVFPGGRVEDDDGSETWRALVTRDDAHRALGVAACRETLEEAAILLADAPVSNDEVARASHAPRDRRHGVARVPRRAKIEARPRVARRDVAMDHAEGRVTPLRRALLRRARAARSTRRPRHDRDDVELLGFAARRPRALRPLGDPARAAHAPHLATPCRIHTCRGGFARRFATPSSIRFAPSSFNKATRSRSRFRAIPNIRSASHASRARRATSSATRTGAQSPRPDSRQRPSRYARTAFAIASARRSLYSSLARRCSSVGFEM